MLQLRSAAASNPLKTLCSTDFAVNNMKPSMDFGGFGLRGTSQLSRQIPALGLLCF